MIYECFKRWGWRQAAKKGVKITFQIFIIFDTQKREKSLMKFRFCHSFSSSQKKGIEWEIFHLVFHPRLFPFLIIFRYKDWMLLLSSLSSQVICYWIDVANKHEDFSMSPSIHFASYQDFCWWKNNKHKQQQQLETNFCLSVVVSLKWNCDKWDKLWIWRRLLCWKCLELET